MKNYRRAAGVLIVACFIIALTIFIFPTNAGEKWHVADNGSLEYPLSEPEYRLGPLETSDNSTVCEVTFLSRGVQISGLLRKPAMQGHGTEKVPGIVLLPGATVTKEGEQGLAKYLASLGYASITLDQRNLGGIDMQGDLKKFLNSQEPTEHKMVHDALAAAMVLRSQPEIDPNKIIYVGESNGARFAIIACALDQRSRGVVAISTCGYGVDEAVASGNLRDSKAIQFFRSIDPGTYLQKIPPRRFVMLHSKNDPIIPYEQAESTFSKAFQPKDMFTAECSVHGRCAEMDATIKEKLAQMAQ